MEKYILFSCFSICLGELIVSVWVSDWVSEWVSDCCLTPTQEFSDISWREQINVQWDL
jgi:hypothetical protein